MWDVSYVIKFRNAAFLVYPSIFSVYGIRRTSGLVGMKFGMSTRGGCGMIITKLNIKSQYFVSIIFFFFSICAKPLGLRELLGQFG